MSSQFSSYKQWIRGDMRRWQIAALLVMLALLITTPGVVQAQSSGHKQTDKLISKSQSTIASIRSTKMQTEETLAGYNGIIEGKVPDNRKAYKKLSNDIRKCENQATKVRQNITSMEEVADVYFADWKNSLAAISDPDLRAMSEKRLNETRTNYEGILKAAEKAGAEFKPFLTSLNDQVTFLGHDLNPSAIADLKDEAADLNAQSKMVFEAVDGTVETASKYTNSIKP
jgi:septal ring factor EnvC (AmiA/AmiB activator)